MQNLTYFQLNRRLLIIIAAILILINLLAWRELSLMADGRLHVHFLDVGQGDAVLVVTPSGKQVLIDGGPDLKVLEHLGKYMPFFDRRIELMVLTHPDADHLTALPNVLRRYEVETVLLAGTDKNTARYRWLLHELEERGTTVLLSRPDRRIEVSDGVTLEMLWPDLASGITIKDANDASVTLRLHYNGTRILLPGDIETWAEQQILAAGTDVSADVMKVPHHGSRTSSSTGWLLAVKPKLAVLSAGRDNRFGHPHAEVTARYESLAIPMRSTALEGTISLKF